MAQPLTTPIFALEESADWNDFENALEASVQYQSDRGRILPLFAFAPMTEPENLDRWEPLKRLPENLLLISIERHIDTRVLRALQHAEHVLGPTLSASATSPVQINFELPIAEVYRYMTEAGVHAFCETHAGEDDMSFFFLRGADGVIVFDRKLRRLKR